MPRIPRINVKEERVVYHAWDVEPNSFCYFLI